MIFDKKHEYNGLEVFLLFGIIHAAMLVLIDNTNLIPKDILPFPLYIVEQVFTIFMVFFLLSYNGSKSLSLLARSFILTVIACIPSVLYFTTEFKDHALSHNEYNIILLTTTTLMCLFVNYSYHKYNSFKLKYYQIYDAIYTSIAKIMLTVAYLIFLMICGILFKAIFTILGSYNVQAALESAEFRKCYISISVAISMWNTYNKEYISELLFGAISTACYYLYWAIAPLGLLFISSYLYSSFLFSKITNINYDAILGLCFISMICNMRLHAAESHWKEQPKLLVTITHIYNRVLPIMPIVLIYHMFFHFTINTTFLGCQAHIMDTGIHWSNVAVLIIITFLLFNNIIAAFFTRKSAYEKNNNLPLFAWYSFYAIILACYVVFVIHANDLKLATDHVAKCENFKEHKSAAVTNIRYLA